jgi:hypothetical protein
VFQARVRHLPVRLDRHNLRRSKLVEWGGVVRMETRTIGVTSVEMWKPFRLKDQRRRGPRGQRLLVLPSRVHPRGRRFRDLPERAVAAPIAESVLEQLK